jgi:hypothetical protein
MQFLTARYSGTRWSAGGVRGRMSFDGVALLAVTSPTAALAHASERMTILTLPTEMYIIGAAATVALTAGISMRAKLLPDLAATRLCDWHAWLPTGLTSVMSAVLLLGLVAVGVLGSRDPLGNLLTLSFWTAFWIGLPLACVLVGNLWRPLNPWTGPVLAARRLIGWAGSVGLSRLGHLPAVLGYFAFAWFEIISIRPDDPAVLARVVAIYWLAIFALAVAEGEEWLEKGEAFTVFFGFIARIAPFWREQDGERISLMAGVPGAQIMRMPPFRAGAMAFITLVLAGVTFDGLADTFWWLALIGVNPLEFPGRSAVIQVNTIGLVAIWALTAASVLGAIWLGLWLAGKVDHFGTVAGPAILSFLPIAAGYHVAHYFVALLTGGQYLIVALNDPLGRGWSLLGLPHHWESFGFLADRFWVQVIWGTQVAIILAAHLLAVQLSLRLVQRVETAPQWRIHLPMTLLMVAYTVLGLWLLSTPTGA